MRIGELRLQRTSAIPSRPWPTEVHSMNLHRLLGHQQGYGSVQAAFEAAYYLTTPTQVGTAAVVQGADGVARIWSVVLDGRTSFSLNQMVGEHGSKNVELLLENPSVMAVVDGSAYVIRPKS